MSDVSPPKHDHHRPQLPHFRDKRFTAGVPPWDQGSAPADLEALAAPAGSSTPTSILVPGCGHAREAAWLPRHAITVACSRLRGRGHAWASCC